MFEVGFDVVAELARAFVQVHDVLVQFVDVRFHVRVVQDFAHIVEVEFAFDVGAHVAEGAADFAHGDDGGAHHFGQALRPDDDDADDAEDDEFGEADVKHGAALLGFFFFAPRFAFDDARVGFRGFLVFEFVGGFFFVFHRVFEAFDGLAEVGTDVTEFFGAKDGNDDDEDDEDDGRRGTWVIVLAAVLLLLIVAGAVLISLTGIGSSKTAEPKPAKSTSASASASEGGESPSPTPSPETTSNAPAKIATVARLVPNNPTFMSETDANLPKLADNNPATVWMSYGFGSGKLAVPFALSAKLQTPTVVSKVTMQQNTGTGGAYTVYVNNQNSLNGATEVGKGTFNGKDAVVELDTSKQSADKGGYVIIQFTEAPKLSQPISIYPYGLRLAELKAE